MELGKKERELVEGEEVWKCRLNDAKQKVMTKKFFVVRESRENAREAI